MTTELERIRRRDEKRRQRARQRGELEPWIAPTTFAADLMAHGVVVRNADGSICLEWTGATNSKGYPIVRFRGKLVLVTRLVLALKLKRPIRLGMFACHTCDNPPCYLPHHLFEGTHDENMDDMVAKGHSRGNTNRPSDVDERSFAERAAARYR